MSMIHKYTVDALGFVPRLWQIWRDPALGPVRCVAVEGLGRRGGYCVTVELLPKAWKI